MSCLSDENLAALVGGSASAESSDADTNPDAPSRPPSERRRSAMTLCPIAIAVTCKKCPAFSVCPLKGVIGDYRKQEETQTKRQADNEKEEVQPD